MRKDQQRSALRDFRQVVFEPFALRIADLETRLHGVVESGDGLHPFGGRHFAGGPEILFINTLQYDDVDAFPVERIGGWPEQLLPFLAEIEEPVVLADHHLYRRLEIAKNLTARLELTRASELRQVTAVQHKIGLRIERIDVINGLYDRADEALVERPFIKMSIRDVGETEWRRPLRSVRAPVFIDRSVRNLDELKRMRRNQALGHHCTHRGGRKFEERTAVAISQGAQDAIAILVESGFNAFMASSHASLRL